MALTLPFLFIWTLLFVTSPATRREQWTMSIIGALVGPVSEILYVRDYWLPQSVLSLNAFGRGWMIEDVLFGFAILGIAGVAYEAVLRLRTAPAPRKVARHASLTILLLFASTLAAGVALGLNSIYASVAAFAAAAVPMLLIRPDLTMDALASGAATMLIMFFSYLFVFTVASNMDALLSQGWLLYGTPLDWRLFNIPLTEMAWGFSLGFFAGPLYEFVKGRRFTAASSRH